MDGRGGAPDNGYVPSGGEEPFWDAVEREDADALAATLDLTDEADAASIRALLPRISTWRRRGQRDTLLGSWRYRTVWKPVRSPGTPAALSGVWLVVAPRDGGDRWIEGCLRALTAHGADARLVPVDPAHADREDLARQVATALSDGATVAKVVSLLALDLAAHPSHPAVPSSLPATTALLQALDDAGIRAPLWCLTRGAYAVPGDNGPANPRQATMWGLVYALAIEDPRRWGGLVDLPEECDEAAQERLCAVLAGIDGEDQVAIRGSAVLVRRLARARPGQKRLDWRPRGTVLITGGTGSLGGALARRLAALGAPHLLLLSRRGAEAPDVAALREDVAAHGTRVTVQACDVADRDALADVLSRIPPDLPLSAVIHAAGVADGAAVGALRPRQFEAVMRPKAIGATNLDALTADLDLDAFVLFSSCAATLPAVTEGNYAAANAFLDALAADRRARGLPATAIAWGAWDGGGMTGEALAEWLRHAGMRLMDPALAVDAFEETIRQDDTCVLVADVDWERFVASSEPTPPRVVLDLPDVRRAGQAFDDAPVTGPAETPLATKLAGLPPQERASEVLDLVRAEAAAILGHTSPTAIEADRPFRSAGFDSLTAVQLRNRLLTVSGLHLPPTLVFDHPTPQELAHHLLTLVDAAADAGADPFEQIGQLEASLCALSEDDDVRASATTRLKALLEKLGGTTGSGPVAELGSLESATDEELFELIDQKPGAP